MPHNSFTGLYVWQVIADLQEEKRRSARASARSDDFAFLLQTERDKLLQQVWMACKRMHSLANRWAHLVDVSASLSLPLLLLFPSHLPVCTVSFFIRENKCDLKPSNWAGKRRSRPMCNSVGWRGPAPFKYRHTSTHTHKHKAVPSETEEEEAIV